MKEPPFGSQGKGRVANAAVLCCPGLVFLRRRPAAARPRPLSVLEAPRMEFVSQHPRL